jgi:hypothetical protein
MDSLQQTQSQVKQSQAKSAPSQAAAPDSHKAAPPAPKADPQVSAPPVSPDAEALRKARGRAIAQLAEQQKAQFVQTAKARAAQEKADAIIARAEAREKAAEELIRNAKDKPMDWLEQNGVKMRQIAERVAKGEPVTDAAKLALDRAIAAEEKLDALKVEWAQREAKAKAEAEFAQAKSDLSKTFEEQRSKLPHFSKIVKKYGQDTLVSEVQSMYRKIQANPETAPYADQYSFGEVLEAIEADWAERASALREEEAPATAASPAAAGAKPSLTNGAASTSTALPPDFKSLPAKKQNEIIKAQYRALKKRA